MVLWFETLGGRRALPHSAFPAERPSGRDPAGGEVAFARRPGPVLLPDRDHPYPGGLGDDHGVPGGPFFHGLSGPPVEAQVGRGIDPGRPSLLRLHDGGPSPRLPGGALFGPGPPGGPLRAAHPWRGPSGLHRDLSSPYQSLSSGGPLLPDILPGDGRSYGHVPLGDGASFLPLAARRLPPDRHDRGPIGGVGPDPLRLQSILPLLAPLQFDHRAPGPLFGGGRPGPAGGGRAPPGFGLPFRGRLRRALASSHVRRGPTGPAAEGRMGRGLASHRVGAGLPPFAFIFFLLVLAPSPARGPVAPMENALRRHPQV